MKLTGVGEMPCMVKWRWTVNHATVTGPPAGLWWTLLLTGTGDGRRNPCRKGASVRTPVGVNPVKEFCWDPLLG